MLGRRHFARCEVFVAALMPVQHVSPAALAADAMLVIAGPGFVPETLRSASGVGRVVADVGLMMAIGAAAVLGGTFSRFSGVGDVCLWAGAAFALVHDTHLLVDFVGRPLSADPYWYFVGAAVIASGWATYRTGRMSRGIAAASWALVLGTALWSVGMMTLSYAFWRTGDGYAFWARRCRLRLPTFRRDGPVAVLAARHAGCGLLPPVAQPGGRCGLRFNRCWRRCSPRVASRHICDASPRQRCPPWARLTEPSERRPT